MRLVGRTESAIPHSYGGKWLTRILAHCSAPRLQCAKLPESLSFLVCREILPLLPYSLLSPLTYKDYALPLEVKYRGWDSLGNLSEHILM